MACIVKDEDLRWEGPVIPFTVDANLTSPERVRLALDAWEDATGVRFVARDTQDDFLHFRHGHEACTSTVGRTGGRQFVTLRPDCGVPEVIHEVGHSLGLHHEHQRPDRGVAVTVNVDNIREDKKHNFTLLDPSDVITTPDYDFQSIMHYFALAFSRNGLPTIESINGEPFGESVGPTDGDTDLVNEAHKSRVGVVRRSDSGVGATGVVHNIALESISPVDLVTAVRTDSGTLKLIVWSLTSQGGVIRAGDSGDEGDGASDIAVAVGRRIVTAHRTNSDNLMLTSWDMTVNPFPLPVSVDKVADSGGQAREASRIQLVALSPTTFLTACRSGSKHLLLISWTLEPDGTFARLRDFEADEEINEVSVAVLRSAVAEPVDTALVATTVRTGNGNARVILWSVSVGDGAITRGADSADQIGEADLIASTIAPTGFLVVSVRAGNDRLKLITLSFSSSGDSLARIGDSGAQAGEIGWNTLINRGPSGGVLSAVAADPPPVLPQPPPQFAGTLKLISWSVGPAGDITRTGDSSDQAGRVSWIALGTSQAPIAPVVTAVRREDTDLALITWDDHPGRGEA